MTTLATPEAPARPHLQQTLLTRDGDIITKWSWDPETTAWTPERTEPFEQLRDRAATA